MALLWCWLWWHIDKIASFTWIRMDNIFSGISSQNQWTLWECLMTKKPFWLRPDKNILTLKEKIKTLAHALLSWNLTLMSLWEPIFISSMRKLIKLKSEHFLILTCFVFRKKDDIMTIDLSWTTLTIHWVQTQSLLTYMKLRMMNGHMNTWLDNVTIILCFHGLSLDTTLNGSSKLMTWEITPMESITNMCSNKNLELHTIWPMFNVPWAQCGKPPKTASWFALLQTKDKTKETKTSESFKTTLFVTPLPKQSEKLNAPLENSMI